MTGLAITTTSIATAPHSTSRKQPAIAEQTATQDNRPAFCRVTLPVDGTFAPPTSFADDPDATSPPNYIQPGRVLPANYGNNVFRFWFGSEKLWTLLPSDGTWRSRGPAKPGDYAYSDKLPWFRIHPGFSEKLEPLTISGKRLDGPAPSFTSTFGNISFLPDNDDAMIMGGVNIPTFGCWEITGQYHDQTLSFTVWVERLQEDRFASSDPPPIFPAGPSRRVRRFLVDGEVEAEDLVYRVTPEISPETVDARASGSVVLHAIIGNDGRPQELQYISGSPFLVKSAMEAVKWWQYRVRLVDGEAVEVDTTIQVSFSALAD
jgi:hypothetical protein